MRTNESPLHRGGNHSAGFSSTGAIVNENDVVIKQCNEVRVFVSVLGDVCIWQGATDGDNQIITLPAECAERVAKAIVRASADACDRAGV